MRFPIIKRDGNRLVLQERNAALRLPAQAARRARLPFGRLLGAKDRVGRDLIRVLDRNRRARLRWRIGEAHGEAIPMASSERRQRGGNRIAFHAARV